LSGGGFGLTGSPASVRVCLEVHVAATSIRDVRIPLRRPEVSVSEHLLHGSQIGASFEEVRRERMAQKMRVDAARL
jgi:hypothetical protein